VAVVCSKAGFAPGTVDVRAAGDTATIYRPAWTSPRRQGGLDRSYPGGSIPEGGSVEVQFVLLP